MNSPRFRLVGLSVCALFICTACVHLCVRKVVNNFDGLDAAISRVSQTHGELRILTVHGMGPTDPGYSANLMAGLGSRLRLVTSGTFTDLPIQKDGQVFGNIRITDYTQNGVRMVRVYEVTWAPTVDAIKNRQFSVDASYNGDRVLGDEYLKTYLMNERLADPVLYIGSYRQHMQYPILCGVERVMKDFAPQDELAIVTYSLGSYMTYDTLLAMSEGHSILGEAGYSSDSVCDLIGHMNYVYMLANQLPLLELSEVRDPTHSEKLPAAVKQIAQIRAQHPHQVSPIDLHLVAFTDPNDLLSYPVSNMNVMESGSNQIAYSDVMISVAHWALLDLAVNPIRAHTGHDTDRRVLDMLAYGYPAVR